MCTKNTTNQRTKRKQYYSFINKKLFSINHKINKMRITIKYNICAINITQIINSIKGICVYQQRSGCQQWSLKYNMYLQIKDQKVQHL